MLTHAKHLATLGAIAVLSLAAACDKVPLLAPTGSVINLFATSSTVPLNGEIEIIANVIENGVATSGGGTGGGTGTPTTSTSAGAGTPVQNGTLVTFTTTIGRVEPREARTSNGQVRVRFIADSQSGTATITAFSGGASGKLENLLVGTAAAKRITVTATNQTLPANGGSTEVMARVETESGTPLAGVPVTFTTTAGTVSPVTATTDASGIARTTLTSTTAADVTATAGAQTGTVKVGIGTRSGLSISASPQTTSAGSAVTFTVSTTTGQTVTNAVLDFGDNTAPANLGTVSGSRTVPHAYNRSGNYTATVSARDSTGNPDFAATNVLIGSAPITLTASRSEAPPNTPVTYTVGGLGSAQVDRYEWTYDDGTTNTTTSPTDTHAWATRGLHTARVAVIGVGGGTIGTAQAVVNVTGL